MDIPSLEDLVRTHVHLPNRPSAQGWYPVLCKVCNDHGKKGPRAGFMFENSGVAYHCFNCDAKGTFIPGESTNISKGLEEILLAFGVDNEDIGRIRLSLLDQKHSDAGPGEKKQVTTKHEPKEIPLPSHFRTLDYDSVWCEVAREYLGERMIDPSSYPFMISTGVCEDLDGQPKQIQAAKILEAQKWTGRVIIPVYKNGKLIFYTGRDMTGEKTKKYESPSTPKHNVLFGFDRLFENTDKPLYIVEGILDALLIDGVAILGNKFTESQLYWLNRSNRQKVYVPDRFGDGQANADVAINQGWSIAFPEPVQGNQSKDVGEAVEKHGKLFVLASLRETTSSSELVARTNIRVFCR